MTYKRIIVTAFFRSQGLPVPKYEYLFHPSRKWRFDIAWPRQKLYLEVDGGIWVRGGHNRGARMRRDWEKRNQATIWGWRGLWCEPNDLCTVNMADTIRDALARDSVHS